MNLPEFMLYFWLGVTILAAIVEAVVPALISIWFVPGGLAALLTAYLGGEIWLQAVLFFVISAVALVITRPLYSRIRKKGTAPTNADRAVGSEGVVTEEINNLHAAGRVSVLGTSWSARSEDPAQIIPAGETVLVQRIEGVKLIVTRK